LSHKGPSNFQLKKILHRRDLCTVRARKSLGTVSSAGGFRTSSPWPGGGRHGPWRSVEGAGKAGRCSIWPAEDAAWAGRPGGARSGRRRMWQGTVRRHSIWPAKDVTGAGRPSEWEISAGGTRSGRGWDGSRASPTTAQALSPSHLPPRRRSRAGTPGIGRIEVVIPNSGPRSSPLFCAPPTPFARSEHE
jgi:hypothetical protein